MTTNKPGSVNQEPLYGCTSCYEDYTWPAGDLRVHDGECWCDPCWDERQDEFPDQTCWGDLELYIPKLQALPVPTIKDAEFLAIRLANVARLVGYPMPDATPEQISDLAGTILGSIAGILRKKQSEDAGVSALVEALEFYARGCHFLLGDENEWESLSGEPQNWIYHESIEAGFENGKFAELALATYRNHGGKA